MLRRCRVFLDQSVGPHKSYKYTFVPDPRKLAPIENMSRREIRPFAVRPPTSYVPTHEVFLEKIDIDRRAPTSDFKATFKDWNDLMLCGRRTLRKRGVPRQTRDAIRENVQAWHNGTPPERFDSKAEVLFYKQFKLGDNSRRIIPELPEKYRPHMQGIDSAPNPDYRYLNQMPEWAVKEEERLKSAKK